MQTLSLIEHAWELARADLTPDEIARRIGKHRATVYRWQTGISLYGIREFLRRYERAKRGRRQPRKTDPVVKARIYGIREQYHHCCGEKIQYWLKRDFGTMISVPTIYRVLAERYHLRSKWKKNVARGPVPKARKPREVVQHDTVDFGGLFAFTSLDTFTRESQVVIRPGLEAKDGVVALDQQMGYFGFTTILQRDGGSEFKAEWTERAQRYCQHIRTARPYKKNEQAFIESFNRTLRKECLGWGHYRRHDLGAVQQRVNAFLHFYNTQRPHLSLNYETPHSYLSHLR